MCLSTEQSHHTPIILIMYPHIFLEIDKLYLKDLNKDVIMELTQKINGDRAVLEKLTRVFGIKHVFSFETFDRICEYFPGTTVGVLKECFEALQLYDLLDLLEKGRPLSLRLALSPEEVGKLRDDRPTKYHTNVAVLVVNDSAETNSAEKIEAFFKDINSQNEVTVIASTISQETRKVLDKIKEMKKRENTLKEKEKRIKRRLEIELPIHRDSLNKEIQMQREGKSVPKIPRGRSKGGLWRYPRGRYLPSTMLDELDEEAVRISHQLDELTIEIEDLRKEQMKTAEDEQMEELETEENEKAKTALSTAMEKWIHNQGWLIT